MPRSVATTSVALVALAATAFAPAVTGGRAAPDGVPDRGPVLAEPVERGELVLSDVASRAPSAKLVDGDAGDWVGEATHVGGAARWDAGELVHSDFLFDAYGADDGADRQRLEDFAGLFYEETRAQRVDQVLRTSGSQLGVPEPFGARDEYGDVRDGNDTADVTEVRLASDGEDLQVLVSVANLADPARLGVLLLADDREGGLGELSFGGLTTDRFDLAVLAADGTAASQPNVLTTVPVGTEPSPVFTTATGVEGWENHLELAVDLDLVTAADGTLDVAVVAGRIEDDGSFTPLNVAYRGEEPVEIYNDRLQAFALLDGTVDAFSSGPVAVADLVGGRTQDWTFGAGYHERQFVSGTNISAERGRDGIHQPYGLFVPSTWEPGAVTPATYWLHYRGGKAHSGVVINPRLALQLGEERGNLMAFPHGRGTSEWYVTESHQDVFEVMDDFEGLFQVDATRRYVSGYSMGGYGSWLFATLYPDLFAAAFVQSGAVTQGAWLGGGAEGDPVDPFAVTAGRTPEQIEDWSGEEVPDDGWIEANSGDARAQLTYRAIENLQHVPFAIDHGTNDELALNGQIERMAAGLTQLGYEHRLTRFVGYEHFTQAIMDEWADGAAYLDRFTIDPNPREVTYAVVPALVHALNTVDPANGATFGFNPDGAYWVDDIVVREVGERTTVDDGQPGPALDAKGTVRATAHAIPAAGGVMVPDAGAVSPVNHSTPFLRTGLQWLEDPAGLTAPAVANALSVDLTNVASASIDVARTGLDATTGATLTLTSDGAATLRLVGAMVDGSLLGGLQAAGGVTVEVDGRDLLVVFTDAASVTLTS